VATDEDVIDLVLDEPGDGVLRPVLEAPAFDGGSAGSGLTMLWSTAPGLSLLNG
jgi:hypothetical protein